MSSKTFAAFRHGRRPTTLLAASCMAVVACGSTLQAKSWKFTGVSKQLEAEFVGMKNGWVVLQDTSGKSFEFAFENFAPADQQYLRALETGGKPPAAANEPGKPNLSRQDYAMKSVETLADQVTTLTGNTEFHVTGKGDPIPGSSFFFTSPDAWLFLDKVAPSVVESKFLDRMRINGAKANASTNVRVVQYGAGTVVIPQEPDYTAMTLFDGKSLTGSSIPLKCYVDYNGARLGKLKGPAASFVLKRGYTATIAQKENGTGVSKNYVAQDHDVVVNEIPAGLSEGVRFVRIFPWRWTSKKGIAGGIWQKLDVGWFYDWNIGANSSPDLEYVAIRQKRDWPGMDQDWKKKGINHLLGFNEPDHKDQANLTVDEAIAGWPVLMGSGLRLGAPAVSDGGLGWLYQFMDKADASGLRVDYVPVHYYRAVSDPKNAKGAADQFYQFLKGIHDRVKRPLWITEWNNGANWTSAPDPNEAQQKEAVEKMIEMLDDTPFVERYALYNWVEDSRQLVRKDGSLTPAGVVYRDKVSPVAFTQPK
ncbi:MAG: glycosyl hydrolase [Luteolibacter sp.]|uniref:glycosyl hydrolase n=1 Tax=Luteolibacter sp. TaxID=1962973 RepID=UPI003266FB57